MRDRNGKGKEEEKTGVWGLRAREDSGVPWLRGTTASSFCPSQPRRSPARVQNTCRNPCRQLVTRESASHPPPFLSTAACRACVRVRRASSICAHRTPRPRPSFPRGRRPSKARPRRPRSRRLGKTTVMIIVASFSLPHPAQRLHRCPPNPPRTPLTAGGRGLHGLAGPKYGGKRVAREVAVVVGPHRATGSRN